MDELPQDWGAVAEGWERWRETLEAGTGTVTDRMLETARVRPGMRVLDIACGIGEPALSAARRVGPEGEVVAVDQAAGMLSLAERRARDLELDNVRFVQADGTTLTGVTGTFDAILCRWGLMFFPDLAAALGRIHALLRDGGCFSAAVWSLPERVPSIHLAMRTVGSLLGEPPLRAGDPGPFRLADGDALRRALITAGFRDVMIEYMPVAFEAPSAQAYVELTQDLSAPVRARVDSLAEDERTRIWEAVRQAAARLALPDGRVRMWNETICVAAVR